MAVSDVERITAFEHHFAKAQATEVVDFSWGFAVLQAEFPHSHNHNRIVVTSAAPAVDILSGADELLGAVGLKHRYVSVDDDSLGQALRPDFVAAGYAHETIVTMIFSGPEPEPSNHEVWMVSLEVTLLAVFDGKNIAAHADLYIDRVDRIAQFESLVTHKDFRCRGYALSLVSDALRRGR